MDSSPVEEKPVQKVTWSTPTEARAAFESLLREVIKVPNTSWKDAVPQLTGDIRFTVCPAGIVDIRLLARQASGNRFLVNLLVA